MDGYRPPATISDVRLAPNPELDAIVQAIDGAVQEKLTAAIPILQAYGLHAHYGDTSARWEQDGSFFRRDEIRIHVTTRYRLCDEEHPETAEPAR